MVDTELQARAELFERQAGLYKGINERVEYINFLSDQVKYINSYTEDTRLEFYRAYDKVPVIMAEIMGSFKDQVFESRNDLVNISLAVSNVLEKLNVTLEEDTVC